MHILERTKRFGRIERRFDSPLPDLLYQMHWLEDMKHRDIALMLHVPRTTITKWFYRFKVPTQSCRRFTDKNLTSWLYKTGRLKKRLRYTGRDLRVQKARANVDFFKKWSPQMAYVLGFFAADGSMYINPRGSKYVSFYSNDREILEKIKKALHAQQKIALKKRYNKDWNKSFILQIGSKEIFRDLTNLGFMPNKEFRLRLPGMPEDCLRHFIRGYFDGDGSVIYGYYKRKARNNKKTPYLLTCFACANIDYLKGLSKLLMKHAGMRKGHIDKEEEHLSYSKLDSIKLFGYMYKSVSREWYLERKYNKFLKAINLGT